MNLLLAVVWLVGARAVDAGAVDSGAATAAVDGGAAPAAVAPAPSAAVAPVPPAADAPAADAPAAPAGTRVALARRISGPFRSLSAYCREVRSAYHECVDSDPDDDQPECVDDPGPPTCDELGSGLAGGPDRLIGPRAAPYAVRFFEVTDDPVYGATDCALALRVGDATWVARDLTCSGTPGESESREALRVETESLRVADVLPGGAPELVVVYRTRRTPGFGDGPTSEQRFVWVCGLSTAGPPACAAPIPLGPSAPPAPPGAPAPRVSFEPDGRLLLPDGPVLVRLP